MKTHLMLDFETLGTRADTIVLSLGAVLFQANIIHNKAEWFFNIDTQTNVGRSLSGSTISWWMSQGADAKNLFSRCVGRGQKIHDVLTELIKFTSGLSFCVWGNGAAFDVSIAEHLFESQGMRIPWKFTNVRCYRTVKAMLGIEKEMERKGVHHDALDDAIFQANCLMRLLMAHPELDQ